jgi:hypothetical protein
MMKNVISVYGRIDRVVGHQPIGSFEPIMLQSLLVDEGTMIDILFRFFLVS